MSWASQFEDFMDSIYHDSSLKKRIILWTFIVLVLPGAFISAVGVPVKIASILVAILVLPLQIGVFVFSRRKKTAVDSYATYIGHSHVDKIVLTHPDFDHIRIEELFRQLNLLEQQGGNRPQSKASLIESSERQLEKTITLDPLLELLLSTNEMLQRRSIQEQEQSPKLSLGPRSDRRSSAPALAPV